MSKIIVSLSNGVTVIRGALVGQTARRFIVHVDGADQVDVELSLERPQWQMKNIEHTSNSYKRA